jgi:uncharacterized protein (TIGR02271 family)
MTRMVTAMFDTRAAAESAAAALMRELSLDRAAVRLHGGDTEFNDATAVVADAEGESDRGLWGALRDLFVPDEDRTTYAEGLRRGSWLVSAEVDEARLDTAMDVLEAHGAVDLDSREAQWRSTGWSGSDTTSTLPTSPEIGVAGTTNEPVQERPGGAGGDFSNHPAPGTMTNEQGRMAGAGLAGASPTGAAPAGTASTGTASTGTASTGARPIATPAPAPMPAAGPMPARASAAPRGAEEAIPVVEERIRVGKRDVERGRVRVRSYVVETPVSEQVTLHNEHVEVERRDVDRAVKPGDDAFRERTIEAVEHGEEPVVAKETRITGEVVLRKEETDRTQTVQDTVRHTEVEVDDENAGAAKPGRTDMPRKP